MLQRLKDVMLRADLPETGVAEIGSEEQLLEQFELALRSQDVTKLMSMTFLHDFRHDQKARHLYQKYEAFTDFPENLVLNTTPKEEVLEKLEPMLEAGYTLIPGSEAQGMVNVRYSERGGGSGLNYGTVDGQWFILGSWAPPDAEADQEGSEEG
jgi:hypothetical protein